MSINTKAKNTYVNNLKRLKNLIEDNDNLSVRDVAKLIGISKTTLYNYLNGQSIIPYDVYLKLEYLLVAKNPV